MLANDSDSNGDPLTALPASGPSNGTLALKADGSFSYTPNADFAGSDSFTYKARDPNGADNTTATVVLTVSAVNDAPVNIVPGPQGTATNLPLLFSSTSGIPISIADVDAGTDHVRVTLTATNGTTMLGRTTGLS